ncbi:MAG: hypothetical protein HQ478_15475 [Chloroflexi bacterium]|nr:hypothetical protein [Chloroflexota bacterium]
MAPRHRLNIVLLFVSLGIATAALAISIADIRSDPTELIARVAVPDANLSLDKTTVPIIFRPADDVVPISSDLPMTRGVESHSVTTAVRTRIEIDAPIPSNLCARWQLYTDDEDQVMVAEFDEGCDLTPPNSPEAIPQELAAIENVALREQLSFLVHNLEWDHYLRLSQKYAQQRYNRQVLGPQE